MYELSKSKLEEDMELARILSNNSRYIDDISVLNHLNFGSIARKIYHPELFLEESETGYHHDTFLDLLIRIFQGKFVIGIYHKVDDFNFEVISFPFPSSNIHSQVGYNVFYSQLVRFFRLCNNISDFLIRVNITRRKLSVRGYSLSTLHKYFLKFCSNYPVCAKYGISDRGESLWKKSFLDHSKTSCLIQDSNTVRKIIKPCSVVLEDIAPSIKDMSDHNTQEDTLPTSSKLDILDGQPNIPEVQTLQTGTICLSYAPTGLENPSNHCYLNSSLQILHRAVYSMGDIHHVTYNSNREGDFAKTLLGCQDNNSCFSVQNLKVLIQAFGHFFDGLQQRDAFECMQRVLNILHDGTKSNLLGVGDDILDGSIANTDDMETSLCRELFTYTIKQTMVCEACSSTSITYLQDNALHVFPSHKCSLSQIIDNSFSDNITKNCVHCMQSSIHSVTRQITCCPRILFVVVNRYEASLTTRKNKGKVKVDRCVSINSSTYKIIGAIHHHGEETTSGHYTARTFFNNHAYFLNDHLIRTLKDEHYISDSVYILFYECV